MIAGTSFLDLDRSAVTRQPLKLRGFPIVAGSSLVLRQPRVRDRNLFDCIQRWFVGEHFRKSIPRQEISDLECSTGLVRYFDVVSL